MTDMTDTPQTSWASALGSIPNWKWSTIGKYAALTMLGVVAYASYSNVGLIREWTLANLPQYASRAEIEAVAGELGKVRGDVAEIRNESVASNFEARLVALEKAVSRRGKK